MKMFNKLLSAFVLLMSCHQAYGDEQFKHTWSSTFRAEFLLHHVSRDLYYFSEATDINDKGEIVGIGSFFGEECAYICVSGVVHKIVLPGKKPWGLKINNKSQVVGNFLIPVGEKDAEHYARGFFLDPEEGLTIIEPLGGDAVTVNDINDLGQVVGVSDTERNSPFGPGKIRHAFIWQKGDMQDLGTLGSDTGIDGDYSEAIAINNLGEVIGMSNFARIVTGNRKLTNARPFYWNGSMQEIRLGDQAIAINNQSNILLGYGPEQTLIWNPAHRMYYDTTLIPRGNAIDINDHNTVLFQSPPSKFSKEPEDTRVTLLVKNALYTNIIYGTDKEFKPMFWNVRVAKINNNNEIVGSSRDRQGRFVTRAYVLRPYCPWNIVNQ